MDARREQMAVDAKETEEKSSEWYRRERTRMKDYEEHEEHEERASGTTNYR